MSPLYSEPFVADGGAFVAQELLRFQERKDAEATDHLAASGQEEGTASAAASERDRLRAEAARLRGEPPA